MIADKSKALKGEPAIIISAVVAVLQIVLAIIAGTTDIVSGTTAIASAVINTAFILAGGVAIRSNVTPVETTPKVDAL